MKALHYSFFVGVWQSLLWSSLATGGRDDNNVFNHATQDPGPFQIGEDVQITISSDHEMSEIRPETVIKGTRVSHTYTVHDTGATYIALHFASLDIEGDCRLLITDQFGKQAYTMRGKDRNGLTSFWARFISGDTAVLSVTCSGKNGVGSFLIDKYAAGFRHLSSKRKENNRPSLRGVINKLPPWEQRREMTVCGTDDLRNSQCFIDSHPTEYKTARSVAKVVINGRGVCTGWLLGNQNVLVTNHHCVRDSQDALNSYVVFNFEVQDGGGDCSRSARESVPNDIQEIYEVDYLISAIRDHDYALLKLKDRVNAPLKRYGFLETESRSTTVGEEIYIPQHPRGDDKAMAIWDSQYGAGERCRTLEPVVSCYGSSLYFDVRYTCDTEPGSSGSPVISAETNKVIALHHCGEEYRCSGNEGVPMTYLHDAFANSLVDGSLAPTQPTEQCQANQHEMLLELQTDLFGYETTWELRDRHGDLIAEGGKDAYLRSNETYSFKYCLEEGLHTLTIEDSYQDGMCCQHSNGGFNVYFDGDLVGTGGAFGSTASVTFGTNSPSERPSISASLEPSTSPSSVPSSIPSTLPSSMSSKAPSIMSSTNPSAEPSVKASDKPSATPSSRPTQSPSIMQSATPSVKASDKPSLTPSSQPSQSPSIMQSATPSVKASDKPSVTPSVQPSFRPTVSPSGRPSESPSIMQSATPSVKASDKPSTTPSQNPSSTASLGPTDLPTFGPTPNPTSGPTSKPTPGPTTSNPSPVPSSNPSSGPTFIPTLRPTTPGPTTPTPTSRPLMFSPTPKAPVAPVIYDGPSFYKPPT